MTAANVVKKSGQDGVEGLALAHHRISSELSVTKLRTDTDTVSVNAPLLPYTDSTVAYKWSLKSANLRLYIYNEDINLSPHDERNCPQPKLP